MTSFRDAFPRWLCAAALAAGLGFPSASLALESSSASTGELLKVQAQVQAVLGKVLPAVVAVRSKGGAASGIIISPDGLVITAAHVTEEPGKRMAVVLADGRTAECRTLGLDRATDAALMRITGSRKDWPHVPLCRELEKPAEGSWCFALGHPGGHDQSRGPVLRVGRILKRGPNTLQTDCILMGGDSGGPLLNLDGELIGAHSNIWPGRDQNKHVSAAPFVRSWERMSKSEIIRDWSHGAGGWLGVSTRISDRFELQVAEIAGASPAEKAGLKKGDVILLLDGEPVYDQPQFSTAISGMAAGDSVSLRVRREAVERNIEVKLGPRPTVE